MDINPIILSIPVYFLLIGLELLVQYFTREKLYGLNDAVTNISCGITQQISGIFLKVSLLAAQITFFKPGWRPDYLGGYMAPPAVDRSAYEKFQIPLPTPMAVYVLVQYVFCLIGSALFLFSAESMPLWQKALAAGIVIYAVCSIGFLLERKAFAFRLEALRLLLMGGSLLVYTQLFLEHQLLSFGCALLLISTYVWLLKIRKAVNRLVVVPAHRPVKA